MIAEFIPVTDPLSPVVDAEEAGVENCPWFAGRMIGGLGLILLVCYLRKLECPGYDAIGNAKISDQTHLKDT